MALEVLRRQLRYRALRVREQTLFKNKAAGLLVENGGPYETKKLHQCKYFQQLLKTGAGRNEELRQLLKVNRPQQESLTSLSRGIGKALNAAPELSARLKALRAVKGVGEIKSLTWTVEVAEPSRFQNHDHAVSYCGLCKAQHNSAGKERRGPLSKKRNGILQTVLLKPRTWRRALAKRCAPCANGKSRKAPRRIRPPSRWRANWCVICWRLTASSLRKKRPGSPPPTASLGTEASAAA